MGTSRSFAELAGKLDKAAENLEASAAKAVNQAGQKVRKVFLASPGAPHMVANRRTTVTAKQVVSANEPAVMVRWTGPAHLVNNPTKPHDIRPRAFVGTRGTGKRAQKGAKLLMLFGVDARKSEGALVLADGSIRGSVHHPGTKGKHFYEAGLLVAVPAAKAEMRKTVASEVGKAFK